MSNEERENELFERIFELEALLNKQVMEGIEKDQEIERLKENKLRPDELVYLLNQELVRQNKDYKSRNEKAIEYITSEEIINMFSSINAREKWLKINHNLLNILQGSDKE